MRSVWQHTCADIRDTTASDQPLTTSGAISIMIAVYGCSLARMAILLSCKKIKGKAKLQKAATLLERLEAASNSLSQLADRDVAAFQGYLAAFKMSKDTDLNAKLRSATIRARRLEATRIPLQSGDEIMRTFILVDELIPLCLTNLLCDLAIAANMLHTSIINLSWSIQENARQLPPEKKQLLNGAVKKLKTRSRVASQKISQRIAQITDS